MEQQRVAGTVYSETVIWMAPTAFVEEAPYQLAIVDLDAGGRKTARIQGKRASIGERVELVEVRNGVPVFRKLAASDVSPA
jgi:uncharacterized OB-fold protein